MALSTNRLVLRSVSRVKRNHTGSQVLSVTGVSSDGGDGKMTGNLFVRDDFFLSSKMNLDVGGGYKNMGYNVSNVTSTRYFSSKSTAVTKRDDAESSAATVSSDGVVALPIDFEVASRVEGQESQIVTVDLEPGQVLRAESGAMLYMTEGVEMETTTGGGMSAGFKRMLTGQNLMISDFRYTGIDGTRGTIALGTDFPSKIVRLSVDEYGGKIVCQKGALLCASHTIDVEMEFAKKMTTGFFGGEGFVLQSLTGRGDVFIKAGGTLIRKDLKDGESLRISSGCLVAFSDGVDFDVQTMKGFKNVIFGGEGLFITTLTGPGTVWLQGQPPQRMISEIARRVPSGGGIGLGVPIGMGGGTGEEVGVDGEESDAIVGEDASTDNTMESLGASEEAIENDRAFTQASSVAGAETAVDSESTSALFGDAAEFAESDAAGAESNEFQEDLGFSDDTNFSTDESTSSDSFEDDTTSFSSYGGDNVTEEGGGGGVMSSLWDLFTDGDGD